MRLGVEHRTTFRFASPPARLVRLLRVTPANSHDQTVVHWRIDVDRDARLREGHDGFGNLVTMLYVDDPGDTLAVAVVGEVVTSHSDGVLHGVAETLPPALFLRATAATPRDPAIAAFATDAAAGQPPLSALHALNEVLASRFAASGDVSDVQADAAAAFAAGQAAPRDLAQVFVVAARSLGIPARYVGGYALVDAAAGRAAPHAWAEAHVDGIGWIGFDPSTGRCPEEAYVRVATALDAVGAAAVTGPGIDTDVQVARLE